MTTSLRVGIAGLGTVGASVIRLLERQAEALAARTGRRISVTGVSARDRSRDRGVEIGDAKWFDDPVALARSSDIDLFVELVGGAEGVAREAVEAALSSGKPVVTANKALLAKHGMSLAKMAEDKRVALAFEASVAGGIPIVKTLREGLAGNEISRVYGILNGTCNYILSRMELEGMSFDDCLKEAQSLGYAEADPTFDIGGFDTAHKLAILTSLAFGTAVDAEAIHVEGITSIRLEDLRSADELGYRIKLLGVAQRTADGIEQRVHPTMVPKSSAIAQVMGVTNAVTIDADAVKELTLVGPAQAAMQLRPPSWPILPTWREAFARRRSACRPHRWPRRLVAPCSGMRAAITSGCRFTTVRAPPPTSPCGWRNGRFRLRASCRRGNAAGRPPARLSPLFSSLMRQLKAQSAKRLTLQSAMGTSRNSRRLSASRESSSTSKWRSRRG